MVMLPPLLRGPIHRVETPIDGGRRLDAREFATVLREHLSAASCAGLVVNSPVGRFGSADLAEAERQELMNICAECVEGRLPILFTAWGFGTAEAARSAAMAEQAGAAAVIVGNPLYWPMDLDGFVNHVTIVANATSLPVLVANEPAITGTPTPPAAIVRLASSLSGFLGLIDCGHSYAWFVEICASLESIKHDAVLLAGSDFALAHLALGAQGIVSNLGRTCPKLISELCDAMKHNVQTRARELQCLIAQHVAQIQVEGDLSTRSKQESLAGRAIGERTCTTIL